MFMKQLKTFLFLFICYSIIYHYTFSRFFITFLSDLSGPDYYIPVRFCFSSRFASFATFGFVLFSQEKGDGKRWLVGLLIRFFLDH